MKIFVAGASGVIGKQLVPRLVARGHQVVGMTRSQSNQSALRELGATPVVADALDADQVGSAVADAEPDVIIHELTSISTFDMRHFDRAFAETNRLRTEGTDNLLAAGRAVEVKRFIAQSFTSWPYARTGGPVKSEGDPLDPTPAKEMLRSLEAIPKLERDFGKPVITSNQAGLWHALRLARIKADGPAVTIGGHLFAIP